MQGRRWLRLLAVLFAFGLVAAACGDSDDGDTSAGSGGDSSSEGSTDDGASSEEEDAEREEALGGGVDEDAAADAVEQAAEVDADEEQAAEQDAAGGVTPSTATSLDQLDELWAGERQATIDMLNAGLADGSFGIGDDGILRGPAGFQIDTNECPADWDPVEGAGDTVRIGHTTAQSGNLAFYGDISVGWQVYNDWVNSQGGIGGKNLEMVVIDDGYVASQTIESVDQLLQSENVFSITTLGSPNTLATYDTINQNCVPQPFVLTGHPAWGDPVNHPWTTGEQMSYSTEAILWGAWIEQNLGDQAPVKVGALIMDNDFGLSYEEGFAAVAEASDVIGEFVFQRHDPAAPTVTNEMTTIAGEDPDVFISMTAGTPCTLAIQEAGRNGLIDSAQALFTPSVCTGIEAVMAPGEEASQGWWAINGGLKGGTDPKYRDEPFYANFRALLEDAGLDTNVDLYYTGARWGWNYEQAVRIASELDGGLTRPNFILAMRSIDMTSPVLLDGIAFAVNGNDDSYFTEGSQYSQFNVETQGWDQVGGIVDLNGQSGNCAWDTQNGGCK